MKTFKQYTKKKKDFVWQEVDPKNPAVYIGPDKDHPEQPKKPIKEDSDFVKERKRKENASRRREKKWRNAPHDVRNEPKEYKEAIHYYTGSTGYKKINKHMWKVHKNQYTGELNHQENNHYIKNISKTLTHESSSAPHTTVVASGMRHLPDHVKPGDTVHAPAFTSTTHDHGIAHEFADNKSHDGETNHKHHYWHSHDIDEKSATLANGVKVHNGEQHDDEKHGHIGFTHEHGKFYAAHHVAKIKIKKGTRGMRSIDHLHQLGEQENEVLLHPGNLKLKKQHYDHDTGHLYSHMEYLGPTKLHKDIK